MKLENIIPLRDAFKQHDRSYTNIGSDYSVSDLIIAPRQVQLRKRYADQITKQPLDILGQLASFRGTAIHGLFEKYLWQVINKGVDPNYLIERRVWDKILGRKISGKFDCWYLKALYDFKTTSVWKYIFADYTDWEAQLNIYACLLRSCGVPVTSVNVLIWFTDWNKINSLKTQGYPQREMDLIPLDLWHDDMQQNYLEQRIKMHIAAESIDDYDLPHCSQKDMWEKETSYAVYKCDAAGKITGAKASRVLKLESAANIWIAKQKSGNFTIQVRPGERIKCANYCKVNEFCSQYSEYLEANNERT